jgi:hypothetical protein
MRFGPVVLALLMTASARLHADAVFIDELMQTPLDVLQTHFEGLKRDGCYRLPDGRYVLLNVDRKTKKPQRVVISASEPCKRPADARTPIELRHRGGIAIGDTTLVVLEKMGRPDASAAPGSDFRQLGDLEYFYVCRAEAECLKHTSVFVREGVVTAISEWYSE